MIRKQNTYKQTTKTNECICIDTLHICALMYVCIYIHTHLSMRVSNFITVHMHVCMYTSID